MLRRNLRQRVSDALLMKNRILVFILEGTHSRSNTRFFLIKGMIGLYRGITPTLAGMIPYAGIAFTINEQGKKHVRIQALSSFSKY